MLLLSRDQNLYYSDIIKYCDTPLKTRSNTPALVKRYNIFKDDMGLLRVKAKISHIGKDSYDFPILLAKDSHVTRAIIRDIHEKKMKHAGKYNVLTQLRKKFFLPSCFATVRKILRQCTHCRRFNNQPIKINTNEFRDFRENPPNIPFRYIMMDYLGPFSVKISGKNSKVYILLFICLYSQAIDLHICLDLSLPNFMRAFQLHVFRYGIAAKCIADAGSQMTAGTEIILKHLKQPETAQYLSHNGIDTVDYTHSPGSCPHLTGYAEMGVKLVKRLMFGTVKKLILNYSDFEFLVAETNHLLNKRPVCFRDGLRDSSNECHVPKAISPEMIIHGYEIPSINVIPALECNSDEFVVNKNSSSEIYDKLAKTRQALSESYATEFLPRILEQATNLSERYIPKSHVRLSPGDIVLINDGFVKRANMPLAIVKEVTENSLGEIVKAKLMKGDTKEIIDRHVTSLIPILESSVRELPNQPDSCNQSSVFHRYEGRPRSSRVAAKVSGEKCRQLQEEGLVTVSTH